MLNLIFQTTMQRKGSCAIDTKDVFSMVMCFEQSSFVTEYKIIDQEGQIVQDIGVFKIGHKPFKKFCTQFEAERLLAQQAA